MLIFYMTQKKIERLSKWMEHIKVAKSHCLLQNIVNYILNAQRT